jgi:sugar lactone lactonase YvrE
MKLFRICVGLLLSAVAGSYEIQPIAQPCEGYPFPEVVCLYRYGAVLPGNFSRFAINNNHAPDAYRHTEVPDDPSFENVDKAEFIVYDKSALATVLGPNPTYEYMYTVPPAVHEAPVYVPATKKFYFSELLPNATFQYEVDIYSENPTLNKYYANPRIYAPAGAAMLNGIVYYCAAGGGEVDGELYRPSLVKWDPVTGESEVLLNNYFGYFITTCDDLVVSKNGDLWFTDNYYGRTIDINPYGPQFRSGTFRFRPSTGAVSIVEDTIDVPNGLAFSPDQKILYITDTGAGHAQDDPSIPSGGIQYNSTGHRTVYAFDVAPGGTALLNRRPIYYSQMYFPDGIKVARNGYIAVATGQGVDILNPEGTIQVRVQANYSVINCGWAGDDFEELWMVGIDGVSRVRWELKGLQLL